MSYQDDECARCGTEHDLEQTPDGLTMCVDCLVAQLHEA